MKFDPNKHHRQSIRLKGYDYTKPGAYFITICTWKRENLFGEIKQGKMQLNRYGEAVQFNWHYLPKRYPNLELDAFVIMPNHIHGIVSLTDKNSPDNFIGAGSPESSQPNPNIDKTAPTHYSHPPIIRPTKRHGLPEIVRGLKTSSARRINQLRVMKGISVWQRGYYEHIIRNEAALNRIRAYIINNPKAWDRDRLHPKEIFDRSNPISLNLD